MIIKRLVKIYITFFRFQLDELLPALSGYHWLHWVHKLNPWRWCARSKTPLGERLCQALETLGPIFVKFGQMLSSRPDLIPEDILMQLTRLQDRVTPFATKLAFASIEKTLRRPIHELFQHVDEIPLASASIAQVHTGILHDGTSVVIKILRPGICRVLEQDLRIMYQLARWLERFSTECRRIRLVDFVKEVDQSLHDELDLQREAANCQQLERFWENDSSYYIPKLYWPYCKTTLLVQERLYGVPISDMAALQQAQVDFRYLAEKLTHIFFTQVFRDSFFHADLHPGNLFVDLSVDPIRPRVMAIDFGMVGALSAGDQYYLASNFQAFFAKDYRRVAELHIESGWVPSHTRIDLFAGAIRAVCEPVFAQPLQHISFANLLLRLFQVARQFEMNIQPQLVLLQKSLFHIEGLGRCLYPELDLWKTARPIVEKWAKSQFSIKKMVLNHWHHYQSRWVLKRFTIPNPPLHPATPPLGTERIILKSITRLAVIAAFGCLFAEHQLLTQQPVRILTISAFCLFIWAIWQPRHNS